MGLYKRMKRMLCYGSTKRIAARKEKSEKIRETYISRDLDIRHHILGPGTVTTGYPLPDFRGERTIRRRWSNVGSAPSDEHRRSHRRSHLSRRVTSNAAAELARDGVDADETTSIDTKTNNRELRKDAPAHDMNDDDVMYACGEESCDHSISKLGPNDHVSVCIYIYIYIYI